MLFKCDFGDCPVLDMTSDQEMFEAAFRSHTDGKQVVCLALFQPLLISFWGGPGPTRQCVSSERSKS